MKTTLSLFAIFLTLNGMASNFQDTVMVDDLWQKEKNIKFVPNLQDSLLSNREMQITDTLPTQKKSKIRILSSSSSGLTIIGSGNDTEIEILGNHKYKNKKNKGYRNFSGHWCGFNFGFVNFTNTDYSDYSASEQDFMELDYANSFVMQFNILEQSINLVPRNNFGLIVGLGLEYQRLRFENKHQSICLDENNRIMPYTLNPDWKVKRNSFKTLYLTVPVLVEVQFPARLRKKVYISAGFMGGIRLHSKTKIVYKNLDGNKKKDKNSDNFNMIPVKADVVARIGYHNLNIWGSYTLTNMFKSNKGPELHPYSLGIGVTF